MVGFVYYVQLMTDTLTKVSHLKGLIRVDKILEVLNTNYLQELS